MSLSNQSRTRQARKSALLSASSPEFQTNAQDISVQRASIYNVGHSFNRLAITQEETLPEQEEESRLRTNLQAAREDGHPLHEQTRAFLEPKVGADLSAVRIHTNTLADQLTRSFDARAFTSQNDIFFRSGVYQPTQTAGLHLLAHEVTHTVQQAEGPVSGLHSIDGIAISDPGDPFERAAQASADQMIAGSSAHGSIAHQVNRPIQTQDTSSRDTSPVIQRAVDAKKSLVQTPASNSEVPDLPGNIVQDLVKACQSTASDAERQKVLDDIYQHLNQGGVIDNVDKLTYGGINKQTYGVTTPIENQSPDSIENKAQIDVFSAAFDSGAAVVYSTIRHELIHAQQYRQMPSAANPENDPFFYEPRGAGKKSVLKGVGYEQSIRHALDEIETYGWEILHANETGVQQANTQGTELPYMKGKTFLRERIDQLRKWYDDLVTCSAKLSKKQESVWRSRIEKAEGIVKEALESQNEQFEKKDIKWPSEAEPKQKKNKQLALSATQQSGGLARVPMKTSKGKSHSSASIAN